MRQQRKQNEEKVGNDPFVSYVCPSTAPTFSLLQKRNVNDKGLRGKIGDDKTFHYVPTSSSVGGAEGNLGERYKPKWEQSSRSVTPQPPPPPQNNNMEITRQKNDGNTVTPDSNNGVEGSISNNDSDTSPSLSAFSPREFQGLNKRCNVVNFQLDLRKFYANMKI